MRQLLKKGVRAASEGAEAGAEGANLLAESRHPLALCAFRPLRRVAAALAWPPPPMKLHRATQCGSAEAVATRWLYRGNRCTRCH
jgi:hypothetical protein